MNREHERDLESRPNLELLRHEGWRIKTTNGSYCVVWRGSTEEVVMIWRNERWERLV